jgi:hypothetical protein
MNLVRAALAAVFLFGQTALAFHHHDAAAVRPEAASWEQAQAPADGPCRLCAAQVQSRISVAPSASIITPDGDGVVPVPPVASAPRASRAASTRERAPPAR